MLDRIEQVADRMARGCRAKIIHGDMQIDLRAGDEPVPEEIANRDEANACAHQVSRERVAETMRRDNLGDARTARGASDSLIDRAA